MQHRKWICAPLLALMACGSGPAASDTHQGADRPFAVETIARFDEPWAMTFIGKGPYALITEKGGRLILFNSRDRSRQLVSGVPQVAYGGQGGFGDVVMAPDDGKDNKYPLYLSWAEPGPKGTRGAAVRRATLVIGKTAQIRDLQIIWRQSPKVSGTGHFGHRLAFSPDGRYLFISSGERQKLSPAQDMSSNLGKIVRLRQDGTVPPDNPFADRGGVTAQIWSLGHRNGLGLAFDSRGRLWESEMGPSGGDEVNLILPSRNYGWPLASNGSHYSGADIPDHRAGDGFEASKAWWNPSISPSSLAYYDADLFPDWKESLFTGALSGEALIRLKIEGDRLVKADHWAMDARIREVEVGPDGALWLLTDGPDAELLRLTPLGPDRR